MDKNRWTHILNNMLIDGKPVRKLDCDQTTEYCRDTLATYERLMKIPDTLAEPPIEEGLGNRNSLLSRLTHANLVRDDNMSPEWTRIYG